MCIFIPARGPLDFALSCYRYHVWGEDLANRYRDGCFRRITEHAGALCLYEVQDASCETAPGVQVSVLACSDEQASPREGEAPAEPETAGGERTRGSPSLGSALPAHP